MKVIYKYIKEETKMIFDNIKNCKMYYGVNPKFQKAIEEKFEIGNMKLTEKKSMHLFRIMIQN